MAPLPLLPVTFFPQVGQPFAFADRDEQVAELYGSLVDAGNALIQGQPPMPARVVVSGYKGVGKSSVIVQVLDMLRNPAAIAPARQATLQGLRVPNEPQRWLVLRVSGKHVRGIDGLPDDLNRNVLSVLSDTARDAEQATPGLLDIPFFHRFFRSREAVLFEKVRAALIAFTLTVDFVRTWRGARLTDKLEETRKVERSLEINTFLEIQLKAKGISATSAEGKAAAAISASFIEKWAHALESKRSIEHEVTINADLATEALNGFFAATTAARLPTIFVLDDFDELASGAGPSQAARAKVLMEVLGIFNQLTPTCLVIAVRQEYLHEDLFRQFHPIYLAPMTQSAAGDMLCAWANAQTPQWSVPQLAELRATGDRYLEKFSPDTPVVVPHGFLQLVTWTLRNGRADESTKSTIQRFLRLRYDGETVRAAMRIADALTPEDFYSCAETIPIDPSSYALRPGERLALEKSGLLRPAMAWSDGDPRVVFDPLIAYLRAASM